MLFSGGDSCPFVPRAGTTGGLTYPAKYAADQYKYGPWAEMITEQTNPQYAAQLPALAVKQ